MIRRTATVLFALTLALFQPGITMPAAAQSALGSLAGTVTDTSGATIAKAAVVAKNKATNLTVNASTSDKGYYQIPNLPLGTYTVTITKEGFTAEEHTDVLVQADQSTTITSRLTVGSLSTKVEVDATPLMNQTDISAGYVLDQKTIQETPLGTGSFTQLAILSPGINADLLGGSGTNQGLGNQSIWANGRPDTSNTLEVNGLNATNIFNGKTSSSVDSTRFTSNTGQKGLSGGIQETSTSVYDAIGESIPTPAPESIQEIHVTTAMYDASQGVHSGAQIQVITKTGTNQFHGQVYDYFQNNDFNAAPFFYNATPSIVTKDPALHRNQFGANTGGPIKKNKLFFFAAYQGVRDTDALGGTSTITVPPDLTSDRSATGLATMLQKDFGVSPGASTLDPAAVALFNFKLPNGQYLIPNPTVTDPNQVKLLNYNVLQNEAAATFTMNQELGNIDYVISDRDRLSLKYIYQDNPGTNPYAASSFNGFQQTLAAGSQSVSIENTTILSPSLTWTQKAGFIRERAFASVANPITPGDIGMNLFGIQNFPGVSISTADTAVNRGFTLGSTSNFANAGMFQNQWDYSMHLNWVLGRHTIYVGGNYDPTQLNVVNLNNDIAKLSFASVATLLEGQIKTGTGSEFFNGASNRYYRAGQIGAFVQDNYRMTSHLTINLGVRWDYNGALSEKYGKLTNFDPSAYQYNAATDTVANTGIVFAGNNPVFHTPGESASTLSGRQWGFAPRVGAAWSPNSKFTVRAGFGIYYDRGEYFTEFSPGAGSGNNGPFGVTLAPPFVNITQATSAGSFTVPFGASAPAAPAAGATSFSALVPNAANVATGATTYLFGGYDPANTLPYTENWSFDVQYQPNSSYLFNIGYIGNHGVHEVIPIPFNQPGLATASSPINGQTTSYGFNVVPSENLKTFDGGNTDLRTPYLGLSNNSVFYEAEGISNYNALIVGVRKRLSKGLQLFGSYTWSHTLDEQSGLGLFYDGNNPNDPRQSYATSTYDRTHVFSLAYHYDIPIFGATNHFVKAALGGWGLSGVTVAESGQPYNPIDFSGSVGGIYYSNFVEIVDPIIPLKPGVTVKQSTLQGTLGVNPNLPSIDPNAFTVPTIAAGTNGVPAGDNLETGFGSGSRNAWRGPFQTRFDMSLSKDMHFRERFHLQYRLDAFNVFNHPSFDAPNSSISLYNGSNPPTAASIASTSLGLTTHTLGSPRFLQMSLRLQF